MYLTYALPRAASAVSAYTGTCCSFLQYPEAIDNHAHRGRPFLETALAYGTWHCQAPSEKVFWLNQFQVDDLSLSTTSSLRRILVS